MSMELGDEQLSLVLFEEAPVRRTWYDGRWFYSVVDIMAILTDSKNPGAYWRKLKQRLVEEGSQILYQCIQLDLLAIDEKQRKTDCMDSDALLVLIELLPALHRRKRTGKSEDSANSGIYAIINTITNERYIGSSRDIANRLAAHRSDLRRGKHYSSLLQTSWNAYGEEHFVFLVLEEVSDFELLEHSEQIYIGIEQPVFNNRSIAINKFSSPIESDKVLRLVHFLKEQSGEKLLSEVTKALQILIDSRIVIPGPNFPTIQEADAAGIITWHALQDFLITKATMEADNIFMEAQANALISRMDIRGEQALNEAHALVGHTVRKTIADLGGMMPETLPTPRKSLHQIQEEAQRRL